MRLTPDTEHPDTTPETASPTMIAQTLKRLSLPVLALAATATLAAAQDKLVIEAGRIVTAAGPDIVEIQKMYLVPEGRGQGLGRHLLSQALTEIRGLPYRLAYLESMSTMHAAHGLYAKFGFLPVDGPLGATGHTICNRFFTLAL